MPLTNHILRIVSFLLTTGKFQTCPRTTRKRSGGIGRVSRTTTRATRKREGLAMASLWVANSASAGILELLRSDTILSMRAIFTLFLHAIVIMMRLLDPV